MNKATRMPQSPSVAPSGRNLKTVRLLTGTGESIDAATLAETIGLELGFYTEEGVRLEIGSAEGSGGSTAMLAEGKADVANTNAPWLLIPAAEGRELPLVTIYNWTRDVQWRFGALARGRLHGFADLKGARVGTSNPGDSAGPGGRAILRDLGLNPEVDVEWLSVGTGQAAAEQLRSGKIDVFASKDYYFAELENLGIKFEYFQPPRLVQEMTGTGISTHRELLREKRQELVGFLRGLTKGSVFALENMEAAVQIHWKLFPESKPASVVERSTLTPTLSQRERESTALRETLHEVWARAEKWSLDGVKLPRWGQHYAPSWEACVKVLGLAPRRLGDLRRFYTDELLDEVNRYDYEQVRRMARAYKGGN